MNKEEIGREGEKIVNAAIEEAAKLAGVACNIYSNIILEYPAILSKTGLLTTEIDHVVVTDFFVFLIETKNGCYKEENEWYQESWLLKTGDKTSNPIRQNALHKKVFFALFNVNQDQIITATTLLKRKGMYTPYVNDYVFTAENLKDNFALILSTKDVAKINRRDICLKLDELQKGSGLKKKEHDANVKFAANAMQWIVSHEKHCHFTMLDKADCPECGSALTLQESMEIDYSRGNSKRSRQYSVNCSNPRCNLKIKYDKRLGRGFDTVTTESILEKKGGWSNLEVRVKTVLDEYRELLEKNVQLQKTMDALNKQRILESERYEEKCKEVDALRVECDKYHHIFAKFYKKE